jgi:hypothetical protein
MFCDIFGIFPVDIAKEKNAVVLAFLQ